MIIYVLLNMWRRKARTVLTVLGIVVGIFALTVLGGLSARLNQQVKGARSWFTNSISVVPAGGSLFGGGADKFFELSKVDPIGAVSGVHGNGDRPDNVPPSPQHAPAGMQMHDPAVAGVGHPDRAIGRAHGDGLGPAEEACHLLEAAVARVYTHHAVVLGVGHPTRAVSRVHRDALRATEV